MKVKESFDASEFIKQRDILFDKIYNLLNDKDFSSKDLTDAFEEFSLNSPIKHDFEFSRENFEIFKKLDFTVKEWMAVYEIFYEVIDSSVLIKLFYYGLIFSGPFADFVKSLEMVIDPDDYSQRDLNYIFDDYGVGIGSEIYDLIVNGGVFKLMSEEITELYFLFDDYFKNRDSSLIKDIKEICRMDCVPFCIANHLAFWINDAEKSAEAFELFPIAINKLYEKQILYESDLDYINEIRVEMDTSYYLSDEEIEEGFLKINDW